MESVKIADLVVGESYLLCNDEDDTKTQFLGYVGNSAVFKPIEGFDLFITDNYPSLGEGVGFPKSSLITFQKA